MTDGGSINVRQVARPVAAPSKGMRGLWQRLRMARGWFGRRARLLRRVRAARAVTERIFETSLDLILVVDRKGTFFQVSPSSLATLGYEPEEMIGRSAVDFLFPEDLDNTRNEMRAARRSGVMRNFICRYVAKDGHVVSFSWTGVWVEDEQRHFFIGRDMTDRLRAEAEVRRLNEELEERVRQRTAQLTAANAELMALHATQQRYRLMVETVRDYAIYTLDPEGNVRSWNEGAARVEGYAAPEIVGRHFSVFYTQEDRANGLPEQVLDMAAIEGRYQFEGWRVRKNGSRFWASVIVTAVHSEGGVLLGFTKITQDMTDQRLADAAIKQLNRQLEQRIAELNDANQELEAFSYSVSHDLRAPLRAIDGFSRILAEDYRETLSDDGRHVVDVVRRNAQQMGRLIDDLLAFSRLGRQSLKTEPVELNPLVDGVLADLRSDHADRRVDISIAPLGVAQADPALLKQVFVNLLSNAIKFTRNREAARIEVGCTPGEGAGPVYHVRDNGAGFDMRYADKLFNVFQRFHRAEEYEGTGVGLAIVNRVVQRHGGRVWADAKPNEGATFYFTLGVS